MKIFSKIVSFILVVSIMLVTPVYADNTVKANTLYELGLFRGTDTGYDLDKTLTREQAVTILYRYAVYKEYDVSGEADLTIFPDADKLSGYARDGMNWACDKEIIKGSNDYGVDYLDPQGGTTRAQLAMVLTRICQE